MIALQGASSGTVNFGWKTRSTPCLQQAHGTAIWSQTALFAPRRTISVTFGRSA
jgi:hypothetical protein